ncbi:MAG: THUMP domain-containing class I SAM-dependent RNA methyltransferase [Deltaproteobacteria bacterium]
MSKFELIATTLLGIESITARELEELGIEVLKVEDGRVTFAGDEITICQANIWLRTAERVLIKVGEFNALTFEDLFQGTKALPWDKWITKNAAFPVKAYSLKSKLQSVPDCQAIVKKAVVEKLKQTYKVDWFEENGSLYRIHLSLLKDKATLMIDTSGEGLHKRGYRELSNEAPLKETLAAALIYISKWRPNKPFVDPFCGSGTIPIEAAMLGANIAPGLKRKFISEDWAQLPAQLWNQTRNQAEKLIKSDVELDISGSDIDSSSVRLSKKNAVIAGVEKFIKFKQLPVSELKSDKQYGTIICNPPYGERLSDIKTAEGIYKEIGNVFTVHETWSYFVLSPNESFEALFGKKSDKNRKLYNGMIKCYFYQYFGPKPPRTNNA